MMATVPDKSSERDQTYPIGSPEWRQKQKILADQRNRQRMLEQQRQEAVEKRLFQREEVPLPSGDTATRNPVDEKPVTYEPDIEKFKREELRKVKDAAIKRTKDQRLTPEPKTPRVSGPQDWAEPDIYHFTDSELHSEYSSSIEKYMANDNDLSTSKQKAALDIIKKTSCMDSEINYQVLDYFGGKTADEDIQSALLNTKEAMNDPNKQVKISLYRREDLDEETAVERTYWRDFFYDGMYYLLGAGADSLFSGFGQVVDLGTGLIDHSSILPGEYESIRIEISFTENVHGQNIKRSYGYDITMGPEGSANTKAKRFDIFDDPRTHSTRPPNPYSFW